MTQDTVVVTQSAINAAEAFVDGLKGRVLMTDRALVKQLLGQAIAAAEQRGFKLCQDAAVKVAQGFEIADHTGQPILRIANAIRTLSIKETGNGE